MDTEDFIAKLILDYYSKIDDCKKLITRDMRNRRIARKEGREEDSLIIFSDITANRARVNAYVQTISDLETVVDYLPIDSPAD